MSYNYQVEKANIFTEDGQVMFIKIRDNIQSMLRTSGAFTMGKAMKGTGSSWTMLACVDRLVELDELKEINTDGRGQERVFIRAWKDDH